MLFAEPARAKVSEERLPNRSCVCQSLGPLSWWWWSRETTEEINTLSSFSLFPHCPIKCWGSYWLNPIRSQSIRKLEIRMIQDTEYDREKQNINLWGKQWTTSTPPIKNTLAVDSLHTFTKAKPMCTLWSSNSTPLYKCECVCVCVCVCVCEREREKCVHMSTKLCGHKCSYFT